MSSFFAGCLFAVVILMVYVFDSRMGDINHLEFKLQRSNDICIEYKTKWNEFVNKKVNREGKKEIKCE